jgi:hypothetical protein
MAFRLLWLMPLSARNLSKIAHIHPPAPPPRWKDGLIAQSAAKRAEAKQAVQGKDFHHGLRQQRQRFTRGGTGGRTTAFTGVPKGAVVVVHTTALAEPRQNSSALLQR